MDDISANRCGYTWPEDYEIGGGPGNQSCCYRETLPDTDRCVWHADPDETEEKNAEALRDALVDVKTRGQTTPVNELLDGAVLCGLEIEKMLSLEHVSLRDANLTNANLVKINLTNADLKGADLTDARLTDADLIEADLYAADLTNADLAMADLTDANLYAANLTNAHFGNANLTGANLYSADLTNADLEAANLTDTSLKGANLTDTNLKAANLTKANLEKARLIGTVLFDSILTKIRPYGARVTAVQINDGTDLDTNKSEYASWWQRGPLTPSPRCGYDLKLEVLEEATNSRYPNRTRLLRKAADTYRMFEELANNNTQPSLESSMFVRRQEMQRKIHRTQREPFQYIFAVISGSVFNYGESLTRIFLWAIITILTYATVYTQFEIIRSTGGGFISNPVDALYFSALTFTTLGLGDFRPDPASEIARLLVTTQAVLGAILIAIFVFVLGRRAAR